MALNNTNSTQLLVGNGVTILIGDITGAGGTLPTFTKTTTATAGAPAGVLTITAEPTPLLVLPGSTTATFTIGKKNQEFRLFGDSGWEQSKILSRNFSIQLTSFIVRAAASTFPDLDAGFALLDKVAAADEEELYVKIRHFVGATTGANPVVTYKTQAGVARVTNMTQNMPADGMIELNLTLNGQGELIYGFEVV